MLDRLKKVFARTPAPAPTPGAAPAPAPADTLPEAAPLDVNAYATCVELPALEFPHRLEGARNRLDPDLAEHLAGFADYVARRPGASTPARQDVLRHIRRTRWHANLVVDPPHAQAFMRWAEEANAILFLVDGSVRDPHGRVLVGRDGASDTGARVPVPIDAQARRGRSDTALRALGVEPAPARMPGVSASELRLRTPVEVAHRALALLLVAERAQAAALRARAPLEVMHRRLPAARRYLTAKEFAFVAAAAPTDADAAPHAHVHESLAVLAWALGRAEGPALPVVPNDPGRLLGLVLRLEADNRAPRQLRPANEILDAADLHARAIDCLQAAATAGREAPLALQSLEVIRERHRALEWLVRGDDPHWGDHDGTP